MKSEKSIASIALTMIILASFLLMRSPLVHGDYVVQNPSMPLDPTDFNATCAMKTLGNGQFYVPNLNVTALKVEFKFNDYLVADQTGGTPPYPNMTRWPDGTVDVYDAIFIAGVFGLSEGQSNWDYMADIIPDRVIDIFDAIKVSTHNGHTGSYDMNLTGVAVAFNLDWNPIPLSPGGYVQIPQGATSFIVCKGGLLYPTGAMVVFGTGTISAPYAYSSTFRFDIPSATSSDAGKTIRYYVMTRLYAPNPSG